MSNKKTSPFGIKDKLGYLFGDLGNDFTFILSSSFLMKFYTDVMGVSAAVVGTAMMTARFIDAFTDVAMGRICDKSRYTAAGKFKPWILRLALPVTVSSFLIYQSSLASMPGLVKIIYLFVTYILWGSFFYTGVNIPYGSMASAISPEPGDRQSLSTYRTMGGMIGGAVVTGGVPLLVYESRNGKDVMIGSRFTAVAGVFSLLALVSYLLCYFLVTERVRAVPPEAKQKSNNAFVMIKNAVGNKALISIIVASVIMLLSQLTMQQMINYVFPNFYGDASMQSVATITMSLGMVVAAVVAKPLAARFGKAEISAASNIFAGIGSLLLFFLRPESVWVYIGFQTVSWIGLGVFSMVSWALITDVIDYSEIRNGIREDGSVYALYSFARKLGQAASSGLSGALLTFIGYSEQTAFDSEVVNGIFNISTLVPAIGFILLGLVLWFWYPLHKKQVQENIRVLKEKRGENSEQE
ncbi:MAG: MFS transporter [Clostridia bacterium]|nr:MFS transporter [Clostridia bacterium]